MAHFMHEAELDLAGFEVVHERPHAGPVDVDAIKPGGASGTELFFPAQDHEEMRVDLAALAGRSSDPKLASGSTRRQAQSGYTMIVHRGLVLRCLPSSLTR